jgi:hypothetical protein
MTVQILQRTGVLLAICPLVFLAALIVQSFIDDWRDGWRPWKGAERP